MEKKRENKKLKAQTVIRTVRFIVMDNKIFLQNKKRLWKRSKFTP